MKLSFTVQIILAMALAVVAGLALQCFGCAEVATRYIAPGGTIFLNLIKFIVCPLVFFSVMSGVVSMDDIKKVGVLGFKTLLIFLVTSALAISLAIALSLAVKGVFPVLEVTASSTAAPAPAAASVGDMFIGMIPSNFAEPFGKVRLVCFVTSDFRSTFAASF